MEETAAEVPQDDEPQVLVSPFERGLAGVSGSLIVHAAVLTLAFTSRANVAAAEVEPSPPRPVMLDARLALPVAQPEGTAVEPEAAVDHTTRELVAVPPASTTPGGSGTLESLRAHTRPRGEAVREAAVFGTAGRLGDDASDVRSPWDTAQVASSEDGGSRTGTVLAIDAPLGETAGRKRDGIGLRSGDAGSALLGTCTRGCRETDGLAASGEITKLSSLWSRPWARSRLAGSPRVRLDRGDRVTGGIPPGIIKRIVRQNFGRLRFCYEQALSHRPDLEAHVTVTFVIGRDGAVSTVSGTSSDAPPALVTCVKRAFHGLSFPEPDTGVVTVTYPVVFSPRG